MSVRLLSRFTAAAIVYGIVGLFWMSTHRYLPAPTQVLPLEIWNSLWVHVLTIGWLSFVAMGVIYYLVPTALNRQLHSERLGQIHFWLTNVTFLLLFLLEGYLVFAIDPLFAAGLPLPEIFARVMPLPIVVDIVGWAGWAVQLLFAYNMARTFTKK